MIYVFDDFELDPSTLELRRAGLPVKADALVLRLLCALLSEAGQLVSKRALIERVWEDRVVSDNVITVAMVRLRRTLGHKPGEHELINNVHGRGYRFVRPVTRREGGLPAASGPGSRPADPPFVGRRSELARLRDALADARTGRGSVCIVSGEAGIGKTRAVEVLARDAEAAGMLVIWGYCHEGSDTPPLWPFVQLVRGSIDSTPVAFQSATWLSAVSELLPLVPAIGPGAVNDATSEREGEQARALPYDLAAQYRVFEAFIRVLAGSSAQTPRLLIIDDLHRADRTSVELLRFWLDQAARAHVLLVGTIRGPGAAPALQNPRLSQILGHRNCHRIALGRLSESAVRDYVSSLLDDPEQRLARAVFAKSEGNPFFMVELAAQLRYAEHPDPQSLAVPAAARELVSQRLRSLDAGARGVLSCAAVIGRSFELSLLAAAMGSEPSALMASLDDAIASETVVAARDSKTAFAFGHELLREVLYDQLSPAERRSCHLRVAAILEQRKLNGESVAASELAYHAHAGLPAGDLRKAVTLCVQAADAADEIYAYADAMRSLRHAREALELTENPSARLRMSLLLREAFCARVSSSSEFEPLIRELIRGARQLRAGAVLAQAALLLGPHQGFPSLSGAREALEEALRTLPADDDANRGSILARLATIGPLAFDAQASAAHAAQARALCERQSTISTRYNALTAQLYLADGPARPALAAETLTALHHLADEHPHRLSLLPVMLDLYRAIRTFSEGDLPGMTAALERAEARGREIHSTELLWHARRFQLLARINQGHEAGSARALAALHVQALEDAIAGAQLLQAYDQIVVLGTGAGQENAPLRSILASDAGDPPSIWSIKLRTLARAGFHEEARVALQRVAPAELARLPCDRDYLGTLAALVRVALDLHATDYAEALYPLLERYPDHFAVHCSFFCEGPITQLLANLARLLGRREQAVSHFQAAIAASERVGLRRCAAQARAELAANV